MECFNPGCDFVCKGAMVIVQLPQESVAISVPLCVGGWVRTLTK